jgi:triosephosphate isomerase
MLKSAGAQFVILGHSERRTLFGETNGVIHEKLKTALKMGLKVILCIGETLKERDSSQTSQILQSQLEACLKGISPSDFSMITIAYEPVWAIGTGKVATAQIAQETHEACRAFIGKKWGGAVAEKLSILYGGSVKPEHMAALMKEPDIDGVLVGGASLDVQAFAQIVNF